MHDLYKNRIIHKYWIWLENMKLFFVNQIKKTDLKAVLELIMLLSLLVVWIVWPLRGTIAARNIALVAGAIASIAWLSLERPKFSIKDFLPIFFLMCVPAWLFVLYLFRPVEPQLQWSDLRGTWLRVTIEIFFAYGLAKLFLSRSKYQVFFIYIIFLWPTVIFLIFLCQGVFTHSWFGEQIYIYIFKSKIGGVYFLFWSLIFALASLHYQMQSQVNLIKKNNLLKITTLVILFICLVDFFLLSSLNAFITIFIAFSLMFAFFIKGYLSGNHGLQLGKVTSIVLGALVFLLAISYSDMRISQEKLTYLVEDVTFSAHAKNVNGAWKWDGSNTGSYPPINTDNARKPHGSTYERVSWYLEGVEFLKSNPLGLGYTGQAFAYYMKNTYPGSRVTKTHSGWLDFALGAGVVGLICVWASMLLIYNRALSLILDMQPKNIAHFYAFWSILVMMFLWAIAELSDREYIEHYFFMLAFLSIVSLPIKKPKN